MARSKATARKPRSARKSKAARKRNKAARKASAAAAAAVVAKQNSTRQGKESVGGAVCYFVNMYGLEFEPIVVGVYSAKELAIQNASAAYEHYFSEFFEDGKFTDIARESDLELEDRSECVGEDGIIYHVLHNFPYSMDFLTASLKEVKLDDVAKIKTARSEETARKASAATATVAATPNSRQQEKKSVGSAAYYAVMIHGFGWLEYEKKITVGVYSTKELAMLNARQAFEHYCQVDEDVEFTGEAKDAMGTEIEDHTQEIGDEGIIYRFEHVTASLKKVELDEQFKG